MQEVDRERDEREAEDAAHGRHPLARTRERLQAARNGSEDEIREAEAHREREEEAEAQRRRALRRDVGQERQDERADAGSGHEPHEEPHRESAGGTRLRTRAVRDEVRSLDLEETEHRQRQRDDDGRDRDENGRLLQPGPEERARERGEDSEGRIRDAHAEDVEEREAERPALLPAGLPAEEPERDRDERVDAGGQVEGEARQEDEPDEERQRFSREASAGGGRPASAEARGERLGRLETDDPRAGLLAVGADEEDGRDSLHVPLLAQRRGPQGRAARRSGISR